MSFFEDASLVYIPSAVKSGKIYSVKPTDGTGDLTFTRASNATRVASNGLIEKVRTNLQIYSEDFRNIAEGGATNTWTPNDTVILSTNNTAPDGTLSATRIRGTSGGNRARQAVIIGTSGAPYSGSIFIRRVSGTANITLRVGDVGTAIGINPSSTWQRFSHTASPSTTTVRLGLVFTNDTDEFEIWGAQLETGDIATDYIATTTAAVSVGPLANVPRLDYLGSSCGKLLLEPQSTALNQFSEQLNNAYWSLARTSAFGSGSVANAVTSPDGTQSAEYVQQASGQTSGGGAFVAILSSTGNYTISVFAKMAEQRYLRLGGALGASGVGLFCNFDLQDGVAGTPSAGVTPKIDNYGNGWYRCSITVSKVDLTGNLAFFYQANTLNGSDATPLNGLYLWGANITATSYLQSYIPTLGTSVTRVADAASKTGISSLIGQTEGTLFAEFNGYENTSDEGNRIIAVGDGTSSTRILIFDSNTNIRFFMASGGTQVDYTSSVSAEGNHKVAIAYANNDVAMYIDGVQVSTDTNATIPACANLYVGTREDGSVSPLAGGIKQALVFKTRLTNAQLAELTTL